MIEAAVASVSNSQVIRTVVDQSASAQSLAANPVRIQKVATQNAPYLSPYVRLAPDTKPILVVRDSDTGAQVNQYPTPAQIRAYQAAQTVQTRLSTSQSQTTDVVVGGDQPDVKQVSYEQAKAVLQNSVQYQEIRKEAVRAASSDAPAAPQPQQQRATSVSVDA